MHWLSALLSLPQVGHFFVKSHLINLGREELRMKCKNLFYPPGLYKVIRIGLLEQDVCDIQNSIEKMIFESLTQLVNVDYN